MIPSRDSHDAEPVLNRILPSDCMSTRACAWLLTVAISRFSEGRNPAGSVPIVVPEDAVPLRSKPLRLTRLSLVFVYCTVEYIPVESDTQPLERGMLDQPV